MPEKSPSLATCRQEIEELHDFFVSWYTGDCAPRAFERMETALAPEFEMVSPEGERMNREAVLAMVRERRSEHERGTYDIDIRNVDLLDAGGDHALARYEEWQTVPDSEDGRISTVLFRLDENAPHGLAWVTVHETWLDDGD